MKVLITGGAGFLGQRLARQLLARGQLRNSAGRVRGITEIVAPVLSIVVTALGNGNASINVAHYDHGRGDFRCNKHSRSRTTGGREIDCAPT